jgi:predicted dehydrogenase
MLNAAIVGLGRWGQVLVDSVQGKSSKIRFTAGVTRTPPKAQDFAKRHGFPLGDDYSAMLENSEIDAVVLATPHQQHADQIAAASKAGKHIFVEKPFTLSKASAEASVAAAASAGVILALGHNRRFLPSIAELRSRLADKALGELLHVETNFSGSGALSYTPEGWRSDRAESPAGGMGAMGIHMVDAVIGLFGRIAEVRTISLRRAVTVDVDDTTSMLFRFENGMTGYLGTLAATVPTQRIEVFGSKGSIEIRDERGFTYRPIGGKPEHTDYPKFDKEKAELEAFAAAVAGEAEYPLPLDEAIHGIAVFDAIVESAVSDRPVKVA